MVAKPTVLLALAALATQASATSISSVDVVRVVDIVHHKDLAALGKLAGSTNNRASSPAALFRRDSDQECMSYAASVLRSAPTGSPELEEHAQNLQSSSMFSGLSTDPCLPTFPASLSEDVVALLTGVAEWEIKSGSSVLAHFSKECGQLLGDEGEGEGGITAEGGALDACPTLGTYVFVGNNATESVAASVILADYLDENGELKKDDESVAARSGSSGLVAGAVAAAGILGLAIVL